MEKRFIPLNAVIALYSVTETSWPRPFFEVGYRLVALEFPLKFDGLPDIVADAIGFKASENRITLHEAKSGTDLREGQAQRYATAPTTYLVRSLSLTVGVGGDPRVQANYVCLREHEDRILWCLSQADVDLPLLSVGDKDITAVGKHFEDRSLAAAFADPLPIPGIPPGIVTLDAESPDEAFDQVVYPSLVAAAATSVQNITVAKLSEESLTYYAVYPPGYQRQLRRKVAESARRASAADPQHWEFRGSPGHLEDGMIRVLATPEEADPRGRTQQYQSMRGRLEAGQRRRPRREIPGQGSLFGGSDVVEELERAGDVDNEAGEEES